MKVKVFRNSNLAELEKELNEYLAKVTPTNYVDIKYAASDEASEAMVITRTEVE